MNKETKDYMVQLTYASSVGFAMVLAIFGGLFIGTWLDRKWGTGHKFALLFFLAGILVGLRNIYVLVKKNFPEEEGEEIQRRIKIEPHRKRPPPKKA